MAENMTLEQLGVVADKVYSRYKRAVAAQIDAEDIMGRDYIDQSYKDRVQYRTDKRYDIAVNESERFFNENASDLHDLAVIETYLGGVTINVAQSILVGQEVAVQTPEHQ